MLASFATYGLVLGPRSVNTGIIEVHTPSPLTREYKAAAMCYAMSA